MKKDMVNGIVCAVIGAAAIMIASQLPASNMAGDIGPKVFPYIAGALLVVCGSLQAVMNLKGPKEKTEFLDKNGWKRLLTLTGVLLVYVVCMKKIGFILPSILLLFILSTMFSQDNHVALWKRVLFAIVLPLIIYVAFTKGLTLRMPMGVLEKALNKLI